MCKPTTVDFFPSLDRLDSFCLYFLWPHAKKEKKLTREMSLIITFIHFNGDIKKKKKKETAANFVFTAVTVRPGLHRACILPHTLKLPLHSLPAGLVWDTPETQGMMTHTSFYTESGTSARWHNPKMLGHPCFSLSVFEINLEHSKPVLQRPRLLTRSW